MKIISESVIFISRWINIVKNKSVTNLIMHRIKQIGNNPDIEFPISTLGLNYISIGDNFVARKNLKLRAFNSFGDRKYFPNLTIGDNVQIETDCNISCINKIIIHNNVLIASGVFISDHSHGLSDYSDIETAPIDRQLYSKGPIIINDNVWIGERAVILPGVEIGRNSIIASNAVVTKDIPPYSVAAGVPAKVIKTIPH